MKDLLEIHDLKDLLGYSDLRSVRSWCLKNNIPLVVLGRRTYTQRQLLVNYVDAKLLSTPVNDIAEHKTEAIRSGSMPQLSKVLKQAGSSPKRKRISSIKNDCSVASIHLLNNIHSA